MVFYEKFDTQQNYIKYYITKLYISILYKCNIIQHNVLDLKP